MLNKKTPVYISLIMTLAGSAITWYVSSAINQTKELEADHGPSLSCHYNITRLPGFHFVSPLVFAEETCQSPELQHIRTQVVNQINTFKTSGTITDASLYLRRLGKPQWMGVSEAEKYLPGSLMKVPELITFMKMKEREPGLLDKKILYTQKIASDKNATYVSKSIIPGNTYTIRELLYYMIAHSDNNATMVLNQLMNIDLFKETFTDLGMPAPDMNAKDLPLSARQFSLFMRVIYNATYLGSRDSEFCAELLSHTDFKAGLTESLPKDLKVAHKFGEAGDHAGAHFSESAIVYIQDSPYLLTVMTKGKDAKALPGVVSKISGNIYNMLSTM